MSESIAMKSLAAAAVVGLFAAYAATAGEVKTLPQYATAHFVYFPTGGHALDPKDQSQIHDVAGMMQSTPDFVATIIGKADTVGSADFNERLSQRRADAVFEALVYDNKVAEHRIQMCWTGERLPFISTADETAESQNRMVAIIISKAMDAHFCGG
jgi:outer membrane protein OmpA-like peptidoglycan-associated protein